MQYKKQQLYKEILRLAPELGSVQYIEDIFRFVIAGVIEWSENPGNLILNIESLGRFYWKKKNLKRDIEIKKLYTDELFKNHKLHRDWVETAEFILSIYDEYEKEKNRVRKMNYGENYKTPEQLKLEFQKKKDEIKNNPKILI